MRSLFIASVLMTLLTACTQAPNNDTYNQNDVGRVFGQVQKGHIVSLRPVTIESEGSGGSVVGAVLGGIGGSTVGQGKGSVAAAIVGAVIGAGVGSAAELAYSSKEYIEFIIQRTDGSLVSLVQSNEGKLVPDDAVLIVHSDTNTSKLIRDTLSVKAP